MSGVASSSFFSSFPSEPVSATGSSGSTELGSAFENILFEKSEMTGKALSVF